MKSFSALWASCQSRHQLFWRSAPALLISLTLLFGSAAVLFWDAPWNGIFPFLWGLYLFFLRKEALLAVGLGMAIGCHLLYKEQPSPGRAQGIFAIASLQPHQTPFGKGSVYKGTLYTAAGSVRCDLYTSGDKPPYRADRDYLLTGKLDLREPYRYAFKPEEWIPIEKSWSFAHLRYMAKEKYAHFLSERCPNFPKAAAFLASLTTGDVEDRMLKYEFGRLGLQHLLAISGFHFGVLIAFASSLLSLFLPRFWKCSLLIALLTSYYLFVGSFPAVQRSWIAATAYLFGKLLRRETGALNLLGFALGVEIVLDPLVATNLGFQFSFASTGGILLLQPVFERMLRPLLPKRSSEESAALSPFAKTAYLLTGFLRNSLALTCSVNAALLPILLVHFHFFPLLSLLYNLFFPFCVGLALFVLLLALTFHWFAPPIASFFFSLSGGFTSYLLDLASYPPSALDYPLLVPAIPAQIVFFSLFALLLIGIHLRERIGSFLK